MSIRGLFLMCWWSGIRVIGCATTKFCYCWASNEHHKCSSHDAAQITTRSLRCVLLLHRL